MEASMTENEPSSVGSEIIAGIVGAGVSLGCLLPPILHLVTGPLGPLIGGFVAANKVRPGVRAQLIVAVTIATVIAGFVAGALSVAASVAAKNELPDWFPASPGRIGGLGAVVWLYAALLSTVGVILRGKVGKN